MTPIGIRGLTKRFGQTVAVDAVDLDIPAGALFFLLGPSGCGKTTLLRMIAGFADPDAGAIRFGEKDVTHTPANRRGCGMVFQSYALWPHMSVRQNVAFGLDVRRIAREEKARRVSAALESVRMLAYADRKPNELSGGQQQRVALARALVVEPTVLLLDEPLSNLDAKLRLEMRSEIRRLCKDARMTAVYVTHDQKEAMSMADGMAVMREGRVVQTGEPRRLYERPASRFVADFLGETNFLEARIAGREGGLVVLETPAGTLRSASFPPDLPEAGEVTCSIRPEAVRLVTAGTPVAAEPRANVLAGKRVGGVYLGEMAQHELALSAARLKAFELNPRGGTEEAGDVRVTVAPEDVVVLRD